MQRRYGIAFGNRESMIGHSGTRSPLPGTPGTIDQSLTDSDPASGNQAPGGNGFAGPFGPRGGPFSDPITTAGTGGTRSGNPLDAAGLPGTIVLDPDSDTGVSGSDGLTSNRTPLLTGLGPANTMVSIRSSLGGVLGTVETDENGNWRFVPPLLRDGEHRLIAVPIGEDGTQGTP